MDPVGDCRENLVLSRRRLVAGSAASLALWGFIPRLAASQGRDPRLLTIVLRGGLDGLSFAAPVGDPAYAKLRGRLAISPAGSGPAAGLPLDPMFALNPSMPRLHALYQKGEALIVHAVASPYRGRSHFDGQDVLESGLAGVGRTDDGWMNRALVALPATDRAERQGLAMGAVVPLIMRGPAPVLSWAPSSDQGTSRGETLERLQDLYAATAPRLAKALAEGNAIDRMAGEAPRSDAMAGGARPLQELVETTETAARFMSRADGPRIGVLSFNGWDTHANEGTVKGQLANRLGGLDSAIGAFVEGMGSAWSDTVVLIVTEFGRTAQANGTDGTDHGTATTACVLGGRVAGGRVLADWPGLGQKALLEGRDLAPTTDLRALAKGLLADHLSLSERVLGERVFPASAGVTPLRGLVRAV